MVYFIIFMERMIIMPKVDNLKRVSKEASKIMDEVAMQVLKEKIVEIREDFENRIKNKQKLLPVYKTFIFRDGPSSITLENIFRSFHFTSDDIWAMMMVPGCGTRLAYNVWGPGGHLDRQFKIYRTIADKLKPHIYRQTIKTPNENFYYVPSDRVSFTWRFGGAKVGQYYCETGEAGIDCKKGKKGKFLCFPKEHVHKWTTEDDKTASRWSLADFTIIDVKNIDDPEYAGRAYFDFILANSQTDLMKLTEEDFRGMKRDWNLPLRIAQALPHKKASSISPEEFAHLLSCR